MAQYVAQGPFIVDLDIVHAEDLFVAPRAAAPPGTRDTAPVRDILQDLRKMGLQDFPGASAQVPQRPSTQDARGTPQASPKPRVPVQGSVAGSSGGSENSKTGRTASTQERKRDKVRLAVSSAVGHGAP